MGWNIKIGNAVPMSREKAINDFDGEGWTCYKFGVEDAKHPDAPFWESHAASGSFDVSGKTNERCPSYTSFGMFIGNTGLTGHVPAFSEGGSDGNCFVLRTEHRDAVRDARVKWERAHPGAVPGWAPGLDSTLAKLIWYEWWMTWALDNCERPAIEMG